MKILISLVVAYIISGLAHVGKEIFARPIDRSAYGRNPSIGMTIFVVFGWPIMSINNNIAIARGNVVRGIAFGLFGSAIQILFIGFIIWCVLLLFGYIFDF